jgi:hypothetical protein
MDSATCSDVNIIGASVEVQQQGGITMKETIDKNNRVRQEFEGLFDMLDHIGNPDELKRGHSQGTGQGDWYGTPTFGGAIDLAREGWEAGTAQITARMREIERAEVEMGIKYDWDVVGESFDVGKMLSGEPECWLQPEPDVARKLIRIYVNVCCSAGISPAEINNRGAAVVALVDVLQKDPSNIVELHVGSVSSDFRPYNRQEQVVMFGASPLPLNAISIALAHTAFFRRLIFAVIDRNNGGDYSGGGRVEELSAKEQEEYSLYLPGSFYDQKRKFDTPESSARWVEEQVARLTASAGNYYEAA